MYTNGTNGAGTSALTLAPVPIVIDQPASLNGHLTTLAPEVYRAINKISKVLSRDGIGKGRQNEQQTYKFRGIDDVMNALSALLAGAELLILPRMKSRVVDERLSSANKPLFFVTVEADFDFVSVVDGSHHVVTMFGEAMDSGDKATNKAMSAAYKYACLQVFCIPTEGMAVADQTTHTPAPKQDPPPPAPRTVVRERQPAPWTNRGQMKAQFSRIRERVGEVVYLEGLAKFEGNIALTWRNSAQALDCFEWLIEQAVA